MNVTDPLSVARGAVRDGAAAVENLGHLLGSRRVGVRALGRALPEVQAGCATLRTAIGELETEIVLTLGPDAEGAAAAHALLAHAVARVEELDAELRQHLDKALETRQRLRLEASVRRVAADLDSMVRLTDLFGAVARRRTTALDLGDLLSERRVAPGAPSIRASVELHTSHGLVGDARVVVELIDFAVATVARAGVPSPRVVAVQAPDGRLTIEVGPPLDPPAPGGVGAPPKGPLAGKPDRFIEVPVRSELPRASDLMRAAARRAGIAIDIAAGGRTVTIAL